MENLTRYKCLLCGRNKFTKRSPHVCKAGFRKHGLIWFEFEADSPETTKLLKEIITTTKSW